MEEEQLIVPAVSSGGTCFLLVLSRDTSQKDAMFGVWTAMSELICRQKINMKSLLYPPITTLFTADNITPYT